MCLIAFQYQNHPDYALILAANRDEFYQRPSLPAQFWPDAPHVLAGRDAKAGGTWMGVTRSGHWAALTNVRDPDRRRADAPSRGHLVRDYLTRTPDPKAFAEDLAGQTDEYNGFNLLLGTPETLYVVSTHAPSPQAVAPGVHGLSNATLNVGWPKVERATRHLKANGDDVRPGALLDVLDDRQKAPTDALPDTGVGTEMEKMLSPIFIESDGYGTRCSTVLLIGREGEVTFVERTYVHGRPKRTRDFAFSLRGQAVERLQDSTDGS